MDFENVFFEGGIFESILINTQVSCWLGWLILLTALISSPQVKGFMILTHINISPELLINPVASKIRMWVEVHL